MAKHHCRIITNHTLNMTWNDIDSTDGMVAFFACLLLTLRSLYVMWWMLEWEKWKRKRKKYAHPFGWLNLPHPQKEPISNPRENTIFDMNIFKYFSWKRKKWRWVLFLFLSVNGICMRSACRSNLNLNSNSKLI